MGWVCVWEFACGTQSARPRLASYFTEQISRGRRYRKLFLQVQEGEDDEE